MLGLVGLWIVSFFGSFLLLQHADRRVGVDSTRNVFINLIIGSIPVGNIVFAIIWWLWVDDNRKEKHE